MTHKPCSIFIGDLVRACAGLDVGADRAMFRLIAHTLGFAVGESPKESALPADGEHFAESVSSATEAPVLTAPSGVESPADSVAVAESGARPTPGAVFHEPHQSTGTTEYSLEYVGQHESVAGKLQGEWAGWDEGTEVTEPMRHTGLLAPLGERAILAEALRTWRPSGNPDVKSVVDLLARRVALVRVPMERVGTLRRGCQLLLDFGEGMDPFARDRRQMHATVNATVRGELVEPLRFKDCPTRGVARPDGPGAHVYQPPKCGTPILIVSDFGLSRGRHFDVESDWFHFFDLVDGAGCPRVAFLPFPPRKWPVALEGRCALVAWMPETSARNVRVARAAHRSPESS